MAKIFIGQRVSDENWEQLIEDTKKIIIVLKKAGHEVYSTLEEKENNFKNPSDWLFHAFKKIDKYDVFLAIVKSEKWSEGLLMEIGYILAKKIKLILAINNKIKNTYLREITKNVVEFNDINDLYNKLIKLKI